MDKFIKKYGQGIAGLLVEAIKEARGPRAYLQISKGFYVSPNDKVFEIFDGRKYKESRRVLVSSSTIEDYVEEHLSGKQQAESSGEVIEVFESPMVLLELLSKKQRFSLQEIARKERLPANMLKKAVAEGTGQSAIIDYSRGQPKFKTVPIIMGDT
ncbi:MAG: hypothetical protein V1839_00090 [archaeon]